MIVSDFQVFRLRWTYLQIVVVSVVQLDFLSVVLRNLHRVTNLFFELFVFVSSVLFPMSRQIL